MASYEIIAMGDAELLRQAFEGVALIAGGDDFIMMIKIGLVVGMIFGLFKALISGKFDLTPMIVGFFVYAIMFGPKETIHIIDPYGDLPQLYSEGVWNPAPGGVVDVANVPIGIAAPFYVISQFSVSLTEKFSQVFSTPNMFEAGDGYMNATRILAKLRDFDGGSRTVGGSGGNATGIAELKQTYVNYWKDCVQPEIDGNQKQIASIQRNPDILAAIRSSNVNRDTIDSTDWTTPSEATPNPQQKSCAAVADVLKEKFESSDYTEALTYGLKTQGISSPDAIRNAFQSMSLEASVTAESMVMNVLMRNMTKCTQQGFNSSDCIAVTQASTQRQTQWAAEQTLFKQVARPMMCFIEMFVVAATPIMAFLVATGMGLALVGKYFQLLAWIALWPVSMTLCNMYIYHSFRKSLFESFPDPSDPISMLSMSGMESTFTTAADWVSVGGMLAASVPMLTFFLVSGSAQAFQSLAGRLQGGDQLDEKISSPDLHKSAAISQRESSFSSSPYSGSSATGMGGTLPSFSLGSAASSSSGESQSAATKNSASFQSAHGSNLMRGIQSAEANGTMASLTKSIDKSMTTTETGMHEKAKGEAVSNKVMAKTAETWDQRANAMAGLGVKLAGTNAGASLTADMKIGKGVEESKGIDRSASEIYKTADATASASRTGMMSQSGTTFTNTLTNGLSKTDQESFTKAVGQMQESQDAVSQANNMQNSAGASANVSGMDLISSVKNQNLGSGLAKTVAGLGLGKEAQRLGSQFIKSNKLGKEEAAILGNATALKNAATKGGAENSGALSSFGKLMSSVTGLNADVKGPSKTLADTHFDKTNAQGNAAAGEAAARTSGVHDRVAEAEKLGSPASTGSPSLNSGGPIGGAPSASRAPSSSQGSPASTGSPSPNGSSAPTPDSLRSADQTAFLANAKEQLKPDEASMNQVGDSFSSLTSSVASEAGRQIAEHPLAVGGVVGANIAMSAANAFIGSKFGAAMKVANGASKATKVAKAAVTTGSASTGSATIATGTAITAGSAILTNP